MILKGDVLSFARHYKGEPFHALLCDAPYELNFMNKGWDNSGVAFRPETWRAFWNLLYPGAFGMTFGGSRTSHRMAVAIEDAGYLIHPMIGYIFGSGFPKATRIDTQIDKAAGVERTEFEERPIAYPDSDTWGIPNKGGLKGDYGMFGVGGNINEGGTRTFSKPATDLAKTWEGHRYGLQALKPAMEIIIVFQKPYEGRPVDNITATGAGALNIEGGRVGGIPPSVPQPEFNSPTGNIYEMKTGVGRNGEMSQSTSGRWPANFIIQHSPECVQVGQKQVKGDKRGVTGIVITKDNADHGIFGTGEHRKGIVFPTYGDKDGLETVANWQCVDGCPARELDRQSGHLTSGLMTPSHKRGNSKSWFTGDEINYTFGDSGGASRFFYQADWNYEKFHYTAKAGGDEREAGLIYHVLCIKCGQLNSRHHLNDEGEDEKCRRNGHPTIKSISLTKHLATLLLPPDEYAPRRLLVPFAGTGSEMIGAQQAGWECIIGIEQEAEYVEIAKARIEYWEKQGIQLEMFEV